MVAGNAVRNGLCASIQRFARPEKRKIFEEAHKAIRKELQPVRYVEELLVAEVGLCILRKRRAAQWVLAQERAEDILRIQLAGANYLSLAEAQVF